MEIVQEASRASARGFVLPVANLLEERPEKGWKSRELVRR